jgi:hypothetical protein
MFLVENVYDKSETTKYQLGYLKKIIGNIIQARPVALALRIKQALFD